MARVPLDCSLPAERVLLALRGQPWPFALTGRWAGGGAIVGSAPVRLLESGDPFEALGAVRARPGEGVGGGWFGWLGYGLGSLVEAVPPRPPRPVPLPDAHLAYYDNVLRLDAAGQWWFESLGEPGARLDEVHALLAAAPPAPPLAQASFAPRAPGAAGHVAAVRECVERIAAGEILQANLCLRLEAEWQGDVAVLFAHAAAALAPAYGACFVTPGGGIASLSPELFLRRGGRVVTTGPIKGTAPRDVDPARLQDSAKDRAEHVMIVDLMRNDLGRVSEYGSVQAPTAPEAQPHPGVWHLVSEVRGRLAAGRDDADLLRATFPPGSVTGAPKVQAMKVIAELEATGREVYTGAIGYASPHAGLELSVAIRTFEAGGGRLWLGAGGGIVADSDPHAEFEECLVKARPLIAAIGGRLDAAVPARSTRVAPPPALAARSTRVAPPPALAARSTRVAPPPALAGRLRPDPALGLFETLLVLDGRPQRLDAHLARLARGLAEVYGLASPADLAARVRALAATARDRARLRIDVVPGEETALSLTPVRSRELPIVLHPYTLPGGLGAHKWRDRALVEALTQTPLLLDSDGSVLEAGWANLLIRRGGALLRPRADGRLLPGTSLPPAAEADLALEDLQRADEILLSSSIAGVVPAVLAATSGRPRAGTPRTRLRSGG